MNTPTPYEISIAKKLEQLPLPDMADSIWASIEMQLDVPASTPEQKNAPKINSKVWFGIFCTVVVIGLLWLYYHNKNKTKNNIPVPASPIENVQPVISSDSTINNIIEKNNLPNKPFIKTDTATFNGFTNKRINVDSITTYPLMPLAKDAASLAHKPIFPAFDSAGIIPPVKKGKGVKGISDSDYRIFSQKKDTANKRD